MFSIEGRRTPLTSLFPYSGIIGWCWLRVWFQWRITWDREGMANLLIISFISKLKTCPSVAVLKTFASFRIWRKVDSSTEIKLFITEKLSFVYWYFYQFMPALRVKSSDILELCDAKSAESPRLFSHTWRLHCTREYKLTSSAVKTKDTRFIFFQVFTFRYIYILLKIKILRYLKTKIQYSK